MHNQGIRGPHDDMNLITFDYKNHNRSSQPSDKYCRFAYATWCPVCDTDSNRRRSKSESVGYDYSKRDVKSQPAKLRTSENANYFDLRERLDSRIRPNIHGLPTTYINNCQKHVPSTANDDRRRRFSNFVEPLLNPETLQKLQSCGKNGEVLKPNGAMNKIEQDKFVTKSSSVPYNAKMISNDHNRSINNHIIHTAQERHNDSKTRNISVKEPNYLPSKPQNNHICKETMPSINCCTRRHLPTPKTAAKVIGVPKFTEDAKTEFDAKELRNINEIKHPDNNCMNENNPTVESKRIRVRQRSESDNLAEANEKRVENCLVMTKKAREVSPHESRRDFRPKISSTKLTSIKSRRKLSAIKLRKVRSKITHSVSSDSNLSGSDNSDFAAEDKPEFSEIGDDFQVDFDAKNSDLSIPSVPTFKGVEKWPIRISLFPHIPPYILFSSHDSEEFNLPRGAERFLKWKLSNITPVVVRKTLTNTGFRLVRSEYSRESSDWTGTWGKHIKSVCFQTLKDNQKLNHFPGTFQIGRKDRLWKNLQKMMFRYGQREFGFIPRTFVLPGDLKLLKHNWEKTGCDKWIIKPPASARGTGIKVIHRWAHLPKKRSLVVQQYISNPYLINGSKFDLRLYVLVTSFNPLRIYLYPDGLVRFASTKYSDDVNTLSDRYMHLTNYSINKLSSQYTANEDANACKGHKWTLSKLWEYLEKQGVNTKMLWKSMQQLVIKTMICGESSITQMYEDNVNSRYNCYEIFGVDILLDEKLKPWLLEVNISPSLHSASPLDLHVKGPLVQSLLNLAQFHLPPKLSRVVNAPPCLNINLYTVHLTSKERMKHLQFTEYNKREVYLKTILNDLTGDDVRHLTQAEDELIVIGSFERIFPTKNTHLYFQYMEPRYYNRLFDAWENMYANNRSQGIKVLQALCEKKIHLCVAPPRITKPLVIETTHETAITKDVVQQEFQIHNQKSPKQTSHSNPSPSLSPVDPTFNSLKNDIRVKITQLNIGSNKTNIPSESAKRMVY